MLMKASEFPGGFRGGRRSDRDVAHCTCALTRTATKSSSTVARHRDVAEYVASVARNHFQGRKRSMSKRLMFVVLAILCPLAAVVSLVAQTSAAPRYKFD